MPVVRLAGFGGENRATHPMLLPETTGTVSLNQKPGRGDLRSWKAPTTVATVPAGRQTIYRMGRDVASDSQYWLSWTGVVHAVLGFDATDTTERTYYSGDGAPKVTDNTSLDGTDPQSNPVVIRPLGVPAPVGAPTVATDTGTWTGSTDTAFYVYTYVNDWGWESAPSPVSAQNDRPSDATATLSAFSAVPAGNYNITLIRIYRTQSSSSGATDFFFLREVAIGTTTTQDDLRDLGEVLPTTTWYPPPDNLTYLTSLWNGMLAGISGNAVRFCESYLPYAWPIGYEILPPDSKPVALAAFGQSLIVLTTARPLIVSGSGPDSMDQQLLELPQGCVAARSVAAMGTGVAWASEDGLCWIGSGGTRVLTEGLMLREDWQALVPSSIIGRMYEGRYFGSYDAGSGRKGFFIDPTNPTGLYFMSTGYTALHFDELRDQLYVLNGANVQKWDAGTAMTYTFRSKLFKQPKPVNFVTAKAQADSYPVTVRLYADSVLRHTQTVTSASPFRLPSGFEATTWQIEIEGSSPVQYAMLATTVAELY